jgi:hypothetical protein
MDESPSICNYIVAHLDILGQEEHLARLAKIDLRDIHKAMDTDDFHESMTKTFGAIDRFRNRFGNFLAESCSRRPCPSIISESERKEYEKIAGLAKIRLQPLADALVISTCLMHLPTYTAMNSLYAILLECAILVPMFLAEGNPIRGGIDLHWAIELKDGEIYGPAFYSAYHLESAVSEYPRITIGDGLIEYITTALSQSVASDREGNHTREIARMCGNLVSMDDDEKYVLDYLGSGCLDLMNDSGETTEVLRDLIPKAFRQAKAFLDKFRQEKNDKLARRYERLLKYYQSRAYVWAPEGIDFEAQ